MRIMKGKDYEEGKYFVAGRLATEKLDGMRAIWDGGVTRDMPSAEVPWANTLKDYRLKVAPISTGLWSRYGHVIHAPDEWLNALPPFALDGELWAGRKNFQDVMSICKRNRANCQEDLWMGTITYWPFDSPPFEEGIVVNDDYRAFSNDIVNTLPWTRLSSKEDEAKAELNELLEEIKTLGGEGVMLREPGLRWHEGVTDQLLKVKPYQEGSGTVVGWTAGKNKYQGMLGALVIEMDNGRIFNLSGMPDSMRKEPLPIGSEVSFMYRELTRAGVPKEGRIINDLS